MMSLYGEYLRERTSDSILESEHGFATYRFMDDGKSVYVIDIYTRSAARGKGQAAELADRIADEARARGCTEMLGTVVPSTKGATTSLKVLLAYGMQVFSAAPDLIVMKKGI